MTAAAPPRCYTSPFTSEDQQRVREELAYLLSTTHFTGSKRYPAFLKWTVDKTLAGDIADLKERTIGVELFGKSPDYDTSNDTIVRFTAGEVRKRLFLAYNHPERDTAVRIGLPAGSYVPEFLRPDTPLPVHSVLDSPRLLPSMPLRESDESVPKSDAVPVAKARLGNLRVGVSVVSILALIVLAVGLMHGYATSDSALDRFWQPIQKSGSSVIIATGAVIPSKESEFGLTPATRNARYPYVSLASAATVAHIGGLMEKDRIEYTVQPSSRVTLPDMLQHPVVLIGTFNNDWTLRLLPSLRFGVTNKHQPAIVNTSDPSQIWRPSWSQGEGDHTRLNDYAIVARYHDKLTENTVVLVAGLEKNGTEAAAQFVTDHRYLDALDQSQPRDWLTKNVEIVLRAKVIEGQSGAPEVVAVYTW